APYEIVGVAFGLLSVWLTVKVSLWCWPIGIISVAAFAILFFEIKLYADMLLQIFFLVTSFLGWYYWLHGGREKAELPITTLSRPQVALLGVGLAISIYVVGYMFSTYTDAHIPFWDATASGMSVLAQLLLMRKMLENWYLWIAVDILSIGIYIYKQVNLTAALYLIFLILSIGGLLDWRRALKTAPAAVEAA
ncbi:MAG: nicotinamide riboside transporter PnuC, partial [Chloroflexia bacterium]